MALIPGGCLPAGRIFTTGVTTHCQVGAKPLQVSGCERTAPHPRHFSGTHWAGGIVAANVRKECLLPPAWQSTQAHAKSYHCGENTYTGHPSCKGSETT